MSMLLTVIPVQVRIVRTLPFFLGTINRILLYGDHEGDTYATGGDIEVIQVLCAGVVLSVNK